MKSSQKSAAATREWHDLSISIPIYVYLSIYLPTYLSIYLSICQKPTTAEDVLELRAPPRDANALRLSVPRPPLGPTPSLHTIP